MLFSLGLIIIVGLSLAGIMQKLHLPRIIGFLLTGMIIGPYVLDWLDPKILGISQELRQIALIIILIKAGLSLNLSDLKKVGRPAVLMAFLPACFEIIAYVLLAPMIFGISRLDAAVMGAVLAAVSPAVVVPRMVQLIEKNYGTDQGIPQLILAGASCDDVFVIVLFSSFLSLAQGGQLAVSTFLDIPLAIGLGILAGAFIGNVLFHLLNRLIQQQPAIQSLLILAVGFWLSNLESQLEGKIAFSGLLATIAMACMIRYLATSSHRSQLTRYFSHLWTGAEIFLFVLVGSAVDLRYALTAGFQAIIMILAALLVRAVGVWLSLLGSHLTTRERLFCIIAYLPKATVQAAIGAVPLAAGMASGQLILSVAVLGILITAPLGAIGIDYTSTRLLNHNA